MKNRYLITFLLFGLTIFQISAQKIAFEGWIRHFKTTTDGRYLILADGPLSTSDGQHQNIVVYDSYTRNSTFVAKNSIYGGFSGAFAYMAFSRILKGNNAYHFVSAVVQVESSSVKNLGEDHFIIGVYDDGRILATKVKIEKKYPAIKSQSGLYIYDPSSRRITQIMSEKVDLGEYLEKAHQFSPDYHFLWKYEDGFEIYDLLNAKKMNAVPELPSFNYSRTELSTIDGPRAVISRFRPTFPERNDYYYDAENNELIFLGDENKPKMDYKFIGGLLYSVDPVNRVVSRLKREGDQFIVDASWSFSSINGLMKGEEYRYELISEVNIAAVPTKQIRDSNMLLVDLRSNEVTDDLNLFPPKGAVEPSSKPSAPVRPVYNSNLLNSYNLLRLPWALDYNSLQGRAIDGLDGASEISGNNGNLSAIGEIGQTQDGDLILLSMWRGIVSGSDVSWFKVSVFGTDGTHKRTENIGVTQKSRGAITNKIEFNVKKEGSTTVISANQQNGNSFDSYKLVINAFGNIIRTSN
ncbi:hypothetical protein [Roseivirga sp.]|uniref:hypothetical protein n=1 Tax=Roseivirga sp. TaxID=1964215 RepID=UPI002B26620F|nr:hypothetical protein [Roseivirga sp.]